MSATVAVETAEVRTCASQGCDKPVTSNLACPKCTQLGMPPAYFCSQDCFKTNYSAHKQVHALAKQIIAAQGYVRVYVYGLLVGSFFVLV